MVHRRACAVAAAAATATLITALAWGNVALSVTTYRVADRRIPQALSGLRIVHLSDLHNASFGSDNRRLLQLIQKQRPDIIVLTGDTVDSRDTDFQTAANLVRAAVGIAPVFLVTGNHEARLAAAGSPVRDEYLEYERELIDAGARILHGEQAEVRHDGEALTIVGVDDPGFVAEGGAHGGITIENLDEHIDPETFCILLSHRPERFDAYADAGVGLALTGHAHGGQVRIPFVGGVIAPHQGFFPRYDAGIHTHGSTRMIVSRGLGNSIVPLRVNNRPELVVVELEHVR